MQLLPLFQTFLVLVPEMQTFEATVVTTDQYNEARSRETWLEPNTPENLGETLLLQVFPLLSNPRVHGMYDSVPNQVPVLEYFFTGRLFTPDAPNGNDVGWPLPKFLGLVRAFVSSKLSRIHALGPVGDGGGARRSPTVRLQYRIVANSQRFLTQLEAHMVDIAGAEALIAAIDDLDDYLLSARS